MDFLTLKYGEGTVELRVSGAKSVGVLHGQQLKAKNVNEMFLGAIQHGCVNCPPLKKLIRPQDEVTVVISDLTRFWMRQDRVCALLIPYLHETIGVPLENIAILVALGTHRAQTEEELKVLVTPGVYEKVRVYNHNCRADDLCYIGTTKLGTEVFVNKLAVGRKVIVIGGTVHHVMAGFGGGRKSILPGISGLSTIKQNHLHSLDPELPQSNPLIGSGKLMGNPLHEDMCEAADLLSPAFSINIVVDSETGNCQWIGGHHRAAWEESCELVQAMMGVPIEKKADIVVVSCGGYPKDISLFQAVKSLLNASQAVRDGGDIVFLAECREGGGAPAFFSWIDSLRRGTLDRDLRADFSVEGYVFFAACEVMAKANVHLLSSILPDIVEGMGMHVYNSLDKLMGNVDISQKDVYVMPYGGSTVPFLSE